MHIGNFLSSELKKQRITIAEVAKLVNKSDTAVRKDIEKEALHQSVIEAYSRVLGMNIYRVLAQEFEGVTYEEKEESPTEFFSEKEKPQELVPPSKNIEVLSVNISVPADKRQAFLKLLMS